MPERSGPVRPSPRNPTPRPASTAQFAARLAREAALMIRALARPSRVRRYKSSEFDILTSTDIKVEARVRRRLSAAYPGWAVVGEEGVHAEGAGEHGAGEHGAGDGGVGELDLSRPTWFVDPVDGTTNYFHGMPLVACNIALWADGALQCGATADVSRMRTYRVERGRGGWLGRQRLAVSDTRSLTRAVLSTGFPNNRAVSADNNLAEFGVLVREVRDVRRIGCAGLDLAWVASGLLDGYWEQGDGPWDWATGALLVREAGGRVTTYDGREWRPGEDTLVATNGHLHDAVLDRIDRARRSLDRG